MSTETADHRIVRRIAGIAMRNLKGWEPEDEDDERYLGWLEEAARGWSEGVYYDALYVMAASDSLNALPTSLLNLLGQVIDRNEDQE